MTGYKSISAVLCCALIFAAATATGVYAAPDTDAVHHSNLKYTATGAHSVDENSKTGSTGVAGLVGWFKTLHHKIVGEKVSVNLFGKSGGTGVGDGILKSVSKNEVVVGSNERQTPGTGTGPSSVTIRRCNWSHWGHWGHCSYRIYRHDWLHRRNEHIRARRSALPIAALRREGNPTKKLDARRRRPENSWFRLKSL